MTVIVDETFFDRRWPLIVLVIIFLVVGSLGNLLVFTVYIHTIKHVENRYFLPLLAVADGCASIATSTFHLLLDLNRPYFPSDSLCKTFQFLSWASTQFSALVLLLLAVQRFLKICRPLGSQMTLKWRRIQTACCLLGSIVVSSPICVFSGIHEQQVIVVGQNISETAAFCVLYSGFNDRGSNHYYRFLFIANSLLFVVIVLLYLLIGRQIYLRYKRLRKAKSSEVKTVENKTDNVTSERIPDTSASVESVRERHHSGIRKKFTTTFSLIIVFYVISYLPFFIVIRSGVNDPVYLYNLPTWKANIILFLHRCYVINNVVNPIIYSIFDSTFRRGVAKFFRAFIMRR